MRHFMERARNVAICALVQVELGSKRPPPMPVVMPFSTAPSHGLRVVAVGGDVVKVRRTACRRLTHGAPQHGDHLGAVDGGVGSRAVGNALVLGPQLRLFVPVGAAERSVSFCRAKIVHSWARVAVALGA